MRFIRYCLRRSETCFPACTAMGFRRRLLPSGRAVARTILICAATVSHRWTMRRSLLSLLRADGRFGSSGVAICCRSASGHFFITVYGRKPQPKRISEWPATGRRISRLHPQSQAAIRAGLPRADLAASTTCSRKMRALSAQVMRSANSRQSCREQSSAPRQAR